MDFATLAFNPLSRMNEIIRYSSVYQETEETLAEHVTEVSTMSYLIARYISNKFSENIDIGSLLEKALLHDADEVLTGDIPRNTKYATREAHKQLNVVAEDAIYLIQKTLGDMPISSVWCSSKSGKEGLIIKIVDMLVVVKKSMTEIELRGNLTFLKVITELETHLLNMINLLTNGEGIKEVDFSPSTVEYLAGLVRQAKDEVTTIRVKYSHIIEKYFIKENVIEGDA